MTELAQGVHIGIAACAITPSLSMRALIEMYQKPFRTWDLVVGPSSRFCNIVLRRLFSPWAVFLAYVGSCRGYGLGGGSTLRTSDAGVLSLCGTLLIGFCLALRGVSTLGTRCASLTGSAAAGSAGASMGVSFLKKSARALSAVILLFPGCSNGDSVAGFWGALTRSAAADIALSAEEVAGIFTLGPALDRS